MKRTIVTGLIGCVILGTISMGATCVSCLELLQTGRGTTDGSYTIDPDGMGGQDPITVDCLMSLAEGGWTKLTGTVAGSVLNQDSNLEREYLFVKNGLWYRSPISNLVWDWNSGKQLTGTYSYFDGSIEKFFELTGSGETNLYGIGCSNGPFNQWKVLIYYPTDKDPANGKVQLCQDQPGIFGSACQDDVTVYVREITDYYIGFLLGDFNLDNKVKLEDFIIFAASWLDTDCNLPEWCHGADLNRDGKVDYLDYTIFASQWGKCFGAGCP